MIRRRVMTECASELKSTDWISGINYDIKWIDGEKITDKGIVDNSSCKRTEFLPCKGATYVYFRGMAVTSNWGFFDEKKKLLRYVSSFGNTYVTVQDGECWVAISNDNDVSGIYGWAEKR